MGGWILPEKSKESNGRSRILYIFLVVTKKEPADAEWRSLTASSRQIHGLLQSWDRRKSQSKSAACSMIGGNIAGTMSIH